MDDQDKSRDWVAGYQARCREEVETYLRIIEAGHQVYDRVIRGLVEAPTFAEREESRFAVLREGHAAGLHIGRPVLDVPGRKGCPVCVEARAAVNRVCGDGDHTAECLSQPESALHCLAAPCEAIPGADDYLRKAAAYTGTHPFRGHEGSPCLFPVGVGTSGYCDRVEDDPVHKRGPVHAHNGDYGVADDPDIPPETVSVHDGPAPCKRHAGQGNQLNCADCGRRRKDFYDRLGRQ